MLDKSQSFFLAMMALVVLFCYAVAVRRTTSVRPTVPLTPPELLSVHTQTVIGPEPHVRGERTAPYTIVEFGDFQCPPCKMAGPMIDDILVRHSGKVRLVFRNNPLSMHRLAKLSADVAESATGDDEYWNLHNALFEHQTELSAERINTIAIRSLGKLNRPHSEGARAKARVDNDVRAARLLGAHGTPAFFVCCPDGRVFRMGSIDQIEAYIK